jgi:hypothetical protein
MTDKRDKRKGRSSGKESRHVRLYHWLTDTDAWKSLNANSRAIYIEIARRYAGGGTNNGRIPYSVREAADALKIGKSTAQRALRDLENRGFIVATWRGHFDRKARHASEWRLTEFGCDVTNALATKDFARWKPENLKPVPVVEPYGTCGGTVRYLRRDRPVAKAS